MKNKGFMLLETLIASTVILGALIFLYAQFSAIKRTFNTSFKYNTIPGLYEAKTLANFLENDGYALYINELSNSDKGYLDINDCHNSRSSLCRKILNNIEAKNVLFVSDNISTLQNDLSINNYDKSIFNEDFKNFILTMNTIENQGRYQLIISYKDNTFASIPIGVSNADEQKMEYQVNHYLMSVDGSSYELKETDEYMWFNGYEITPEVKSYTGFTSPESQKIILTKDSNVVNYYYVRNKYNVIVNYDEHVKSIENNGLKYQGSDVEIIVNLEDGYKIASVTGDVTSTSFTMPTHDVTLNIKTNVQSYTLSFNANGGAVSTTSKTVTYASTYGTLPTPSRTGYTFLGWYTAKSGGTKITSTSKVNITSNQTLYAQWEQIKYTLTIKSSDSSLNVSGSGKYIAGETVTISLSGSYQSTSFTYKMPSKNTTITWANVLNYSTTATNRGGGSVENSIAQASYQYNITESNYYFAELDMEGNVQWYPINDFANYYSYLKFGDTLYTSGFGRAGYIEKNKSIIGKYVGSAKTYTLTGYFKMKVYKATIN